MLAWAVTFTLVIRVFARTFKYNVRHTVLASFFHLSFWGLKGKQNNTIMKKTITIFFLLIAALAAKAQDRIVMKDGSVIYASVKSITEQDVRYCVVITDAGGTTYVDENTVRVVLLDKVESITHASGKQLYPTKQSRQDTITKNRKNYLAQRQISPYIVPQYKNPAYAFLLSAIPGVGQFYNDEIDKGFGFITATLIESAVFTLSCNNLTKMVTYTENGIENEREVTNGLAVVGAIGSGIAFFVTFLWSSIDAVTTANELNIYNGYVVRISPTFSHVSSTDLGSSGFAAGLNLSLSF